jgi:hypothetical protein
LVVGCNPPLTTGLMLREFSGISRALIRGRARFRVVLTVS